MDVVGQRTGREHALRAEAGACTRCPGLVASRTQVVFGAGDPAADLMFVAEVPGAEEDERGLPLLGRAGRLLDELLGEVGLARANAWVTHVVRCRPPGNRDPEPSEVANCGHWLSAQLDLVRPIVVCPVGGVPTKLLRASPTGILQARGRDEVRVVGPLAVRLLPLLHPAAALYSPEGVELLRRDIHRIPALLALGPPPPPSPSSQPPASPSVLSRPASSSVPSRPASSSVPSRPAAVAAASGRGEPGGHDRDRSRRKPERPEREGPTTDGPAPVPPDQLNLF